MYVAVSAVRRRGFSPATATAATATAATATATRGDAWCNGLHVCFPSLPPMQLHGFESRLGLESSCFSV